MTPKCPKCDNVSFETADVNVKHKENNLDMFAIICSKCGAIMNFCDSDSIYHLEIHATKIMAEIDGVCYELKKDIDSIKGHIYRQISLLKEK